LTPLLLVLAWTIVFGVAAARMAVAASRPMLTWAVYGAILGPLALLLLRAAPPGRCRQCESRVHGWDFVCRFCGDDVRGLPAVPARGSAIPEPSTAPEPPPAVGSTVPDAGVAPPRQPIADTPSAARKAERLTANTRTVERSTSVSGTRPRRQPVRTVPAPAPAPAPAPPPATVAPPRPVAYESRGARGRRRAKPDPGRVLGAGLFLTGTASLLPGYRYTIAVTETRLRILGPLDVDPEKVVMDRDLAPFDALVTEGRVMLTEGAPDRPRMFLVFERISGTTPEGLAGEIVAAVRAVPRAG